jgi:pyruvate kinase
MTKVGTPKDPVAQFNRTVKAAKDDSYIEPLEADGIAQAAERAVEHATQQGDPAARGKVLTQLQALSKLSPLYADPVAADHLKAAHARLQGGEVVSDAAQRLFGPRPADGRRTYVMSTIGFTSQHKDVIGEMLKAGTNIIRLNMAHRPTENPAKDHMPGYIDNARAASSETGRPMRFIADLGGPKIRLADWDREKIGAQKLVDDAPVELAMHGKQVDANHLPIDDQILVDSVKVGDRLLLVDGKIELKVTGKDKDKIQATVVRGGEIAPGKGIALPDSKWLGATITDKDKEDIKFCVKSGVEILGISFCSSAADVQQVRQLAREAAVEAGFDLGTWVEPSIVAKIETRAGMANLEEIAAAADGMMVARGDLSSEIGWENVPAAQAEINRVGNILGKPVIVATGVLPSMEKGSQPTQAEADAVWNMVQQGTEVLMTAKETTRGDDPAAVVKAAVQALKAAEAGVGKGPMALRLKQTAAKAFTGRIDDVSDRLGKPGQTFRGKLASVFPLHGADGQAWVAVRKKSGEEQVLKVTGLDVGRRLSDDSWIDLLDATFKTHAPKTVAVEIASGEKPGDAGNWEDGAEKVDLNVVGSVHVHKWTT